MNNLIDIRSIPYVGNHYYNESYVRYGQTDLDELSEDELKKELEHTKKEIKTVKEEIEDSNKSFPIYSLKEKLENAELYKEKIEKALAEYNK